MRVYVQQFHDKLGPLLEEFTCVLVERDVEDDVKFSRGRMIWFKMYSTM